MLRNGKNLTEKIQGAIFSKIFHWFKQKNPRVMELPTKEKINIQLLNNEYVPTFHIFIK